MKYKYMNANNILKLAQHFYSLAAIPLPLRDLKSFLTNFPNKVKKVLEMIKNNASPKSTLEEDELNDFLSRVFRRTSDDIQYLIKSSDKLIKKLDEVSSTFDQTLKAGEEKDSYYFNKFKNYSFEALKYFQYDLEDLKNFINNNFSIESNPDIEMFYNDYYVDNSYEKDIDNGDYYKGLIKLPELINTLDSDISHYLNLIKEYQASASRYSRSGIGEVPPPSENEEILYHASINADKIFENGFSTSPAKIEGLGGSTSTKTHGKHGISFTADLYIAKEIARCLKEAIMIANNEINGFDILEWSDDKNKLLESTKSIYGSNLDLTEPVDSFKLYTVYLSYSKRYDPVFFGDHENMINTFKQKSPQDVGIIAAKINMKDPNILYLQSMLEYRVPTESVISIEKLIK